MQDTINVEVGEGAGELVIFHNIFFKWWGFSYQNAPAYIIICRFAALYFVRRGLARRA
jgi:hypothetical protein